MYSVGGGGGPTYAGCLTAFVMWFVLTGMMGGVIYAICIGIAQDFPFQ